MSRTLNWLSYDGHKYSEYDDNDFIPGCSNIYTLVDSHDTYIETNMNKKTVVFIVASSKYLIVAWKVPMTFLLISTVDVDVSGLWVETAIALEVSDATEE